MKAGGLQVINGTGTLRVLSDFTSRHLHSGSLTFSVALRKSVCVGEHGGSEGLFCIQGTLKVEIANRSSQGTSGWKRIEVLLLLEHVVQTERHLGQMLCNLETLVKQLGVPVTGNGVQSWGQTVIC